jgi:hypothetical protein
MFFCGSISFFDQTNPSVYILFWVKGCRLNGATFSKENTFDLQCFSFSEYLEEDNCCGTFGMRTPYILSITRFFHKENVAGRVKCYQYSATANP